MKAVKIVEVGLRDGLQNEALTVSAEIKIELASKLIAAGVKNLEIGSFVRPDRVPQMADSKQVIDSLLVSFQKEIKNKKICLSALVPNEKGMQEALKTNIREIAIFGSASETFSKKNINCTIEESFSRFLPVMVEAKKNKIKVRGYISCCFDCPYEGPIAENTVLKIAKRLHKLGCYEISIGDTIGVATPPRVKSLFSKLKRHIPVKQLAGHFHDTRGTALANIAAAYGLGIRVFDTSIGGLGGCPYAPGAAGNVATEDVVYLFDGMKVQTGIDVSQIIEVNHWLSEKMGRKLPSKLGLAGLAKPLGKI